MRTRRISYRFSFLRFAAAIVVVGLAVSPALGSQIFLSLNGIPGESEFKGRAGDIDVLSWSFEVKRPIDDSGTGGGRAASRAEFGDLVVTKLLDKSSPLLAKHVADGARIQTARLALRGEGNFVEASTLEYLVIELTHVTVTKYSVTGEAGSGDITRPQETVAFSFEEIEMTYTEADFVTGQINGEVGFQWNVVTNEP